MRARGNQQITSANKSRWSSFQTHSYPTGEKQFTVPIKQLFGRLFEHGQGRKKVLEAIQVTRTQLPMVSAFEITNYKAQGLTMNKTVVDLQVPLGALQVVSIYVPFSRVKKAEDVAILRSSHMKVLQLRPSSDQDDELKRLDELDRRVQREYDFYFLKLYK